LILALLPISIDHRVQIHLLHAKPFSFVKIAVLFVD